MNWGSFLIYTFHFHFQHITLIRSLAQLFLAIQVHFTWTKWPYWTSAMAGGLLKTFLEGKLEWKTDKNKDHCIMNALPEPPCVSDGSAAHDCQGRVWVSQWEWRPPLHPGTLLLGRLHGVWHRWTGEASTGDTKSFLLICIKSLFLVSFSIVIPV